MGTECCGNEKKNLPSDNNNFSFTNEEKVKKGNNLTLKKTKILYEKANKSICEIIKDKGYGSGFFCKIKNPNNFDGIY